MSGYNQSARSPHPGRHPHDVRALLFGLAALPILAAALPAVADEPSSGQRVFETAHLHRQRGQVDAMHTRFRDHTNALFQKHGMDHGRLLGPQDDKDGKANTLVYLLAFPSREAARKSWAAFRDDPEWQKAKAESEKGRRARRQGEVRLPRTPTDYSPIK